MDGRRVAGDDGRAGHREARRTGRAFDDGHEHPGSLVGRVVADGAGVVEGEAAGVQYTATPGNSFSLAETSVVADGAGAVEGEAAGVEDAAVVAHDRAVVVHDEPAPLVIEDRCRVDAPVAADDTRVVHRDAAPVVEGELTHVAADGAGIVQHESARVDDATRLVRAPRFTD